MGLRFDWDSACACNSDWDWDCNSIGIGIRLGFDRDSEWCWDCDSIVILIAIEFRGCPRKTILMGVERMGVLRSISNFESRITQFSVKI